MVPPPLRNSAHDHDGTPLVVLENTPDVHNVVVCTLCSCYPRPVLGLPPDWYKSSSYRRRVIRWPRAVLSEFGTVIPDNVEVRVADSTANMRYLVLPMQPEGTDDWTEEQLMRILTGNTRWRGYPTADHCLQPQE